MVMCVFTTRFYGTYPEFLLDIFSLQIGVHLENFERVKIPKIQSIVIQLVIAEGLDQITNLNKVWRTEYFLIVKTTLKITAMFAMQITDQEFNNKTYIDMMALINCGRGGEGDDV